VFKNKAELKTAGVVVKLLILAALATVLVTAATYYNLRELLRDTLQ